MNSKYCQIYVIFFTLLGLCLSDPILSFGEPMLPDNVQADILQNQIVQAAKLNDLKSALVAIKKYHSLKVAFPNPLYLIEAEASYKERDYGRAYDALNSFLRVEKKGSEQYNEAIGLYTAYEKAAKSILEERNKVLEERKKYAENEQRKREESVERCENYCRNNDVYVGNIETCETDEELSCREIYRGSHDAESRRDREDCINSGKRSCSAGLNACLSNCKSRNQ